MGDTAREGTAEHAFCVVGGVVGDGAKVPTAVFSLCASGLDASTYLASHFPDGAMPAIIYADDLVM